MGGLERRVLLIFLEYFVIYDMNVQICFDKNLCEIFRVQNQNFLSSKNSNLIFIECTKRSYV